MPGLDDHIKRINDKLQQLLKQHHALQKDNERLKDTVKKLEGKNQELTEQSEQFTQQVHILKATSGKMNDDDKKAFEKKINQYLKEVDKCITLLSE